MKHPKFGDKIEVIFASDDNPHKFGTFVRVVYRRGRVNSGCFYELTDKKGDFWQTTVDGCRALTTQELSNDNGKLRE